MYTILLSGITTLYHGTRFHCRGTTTLVSHGTYYLLWYCHYAGAVWFYPAEVWYYIVLSVWNLNGEICDNLLTSLTKAYIHLCSMYNMYGTFLAKLWHDDTSGARLELTNVYLARCMRHIKVFLKGIPSALAPRAGKCLSSYWICIQLRLIVLAWTFSTQHVVQQRLCHNWSSIVESCEL